jgi:hypothetical protein
VTSFTIDVNFVRDDQGRAPNGEFAKAGEVAEKHGFRYHGQNPIEESGRAGAHVWKHPGGAELRIRRGGIGREAGKPVAIVQTAPNTSHSYQHTWPETAAKGALKKAGFTPIKK